MSVILSMRHSSGSTRGEVVTIPPLADERRWRLYNQARLAMAPELSRQQVADRYRATKVSIIPNQSEPYKKLAGSSPHGLAWCSTQEQRHLRDVTGNVSTPGSLDVSVRAAMKPFTP
jgi:hypothetical protein